MKTEFHHTLGWVLFKSGELKSSIQSFKRALDLNPNYIIARYNLGLVLVFLCVMVFILSGFEHCIADMYYFSAAGMWNGDTLVRTLWMTLGNSLGGFLLPLLGRR